MKTNYRRLLIMLTIGAWLVGAASTSAFAGISLSPKPSEATVNSVWNWLCVWSDDRGIMPTVDPNGLTEGTIDYGQRYVTGRPWVNYTAGKVRAPIPELWVDTLDLWPKVTAPDGFPGFPQATPAEILAPEEYQEPAYSSVQPNPVDNPDPNNPGQRLPETDGGQLYDHGVSYVANYPVDISRSVNLKCDGTGPAAPDASGVIPPPPDPADPLSTVRFVSGGACDRLTSDGLTTIGVKWNAFIVLPDYPVALVGVWKDNTRTKPVRAKITPVDGLQTFSPADVLNTTWTQKYNVVEILDDTKGVSTLYIQYYRPGSDYVITKNAPLPLPYTVYTVKLSHADDPYLGINDAIIHFDPLRNAVPSVSDTVNGNPYNFSTNPVDPNRLAKQCGIIGIYATNKLNAPTASDPVNYFDLDPVTGFLPGQTRYVLTNTGLGRAYFSKTLPADYNIAGMTFYVKVSTNAVDGVWLASDMSGPNYYLRSAGPNAPKPIGYDAHGGIIRLGRPLPAPAVDPSVGPWLSGSQCYVSVRNLSPDTYTIGATPDLAYVTMVDDLRPGLPTGTTYDYNPVTTSVGNDGQFTIGAPKPPAGTYAARINYNLECSSPTVYFNGTIPMNYIRYGAKQGAEFRVSVSAGLNMFDPLTGQPNPKQNPSADRALNMSRLNNRLLYDPNDYPMYPESSLVPRTAWPAPDTRLFSVIGTMIKDKKLVTQEVRDIPVTVQHCASYSYNIQGGMGYTPGAINYNGTSDLDWLTCVSDAAQPSLTDVDPLSVEPLEEANPTFPDDGSSSTQFVFRVGYRNRNAIQPKPWLHEGDDIWNMWMGTRGSNDNTVVLYLDENGTGDYRPHFMRREFPDLPSAIGGNGEDVYIYRVIPHSDIGVRPTTGTSLWPIQYWANVRPDGTLEDNHLYQSLACGTYHYFFACTDDSLKFDDPAGTFVFEHQYYGSMDPANPAGKTGLEEWGQIGGFYGSYGGIYGGSGGFNSSTGLDPSTSRAVTGYGAIDRAEHRRYSADGSSIPPFDYTLFVDRPVRAPGMFEAARQYPYLQQSELHPRVSCELHMPSVDDLDKRFDDTTYGWGRFFGTLFPYRSAVNPLMVGAWLPSDPVTGELTSGGDDALRSETSGSYSKDTNVFSILYRQIDNKAPVSIKLMVNSASEKTLPVGELDPLNLHQYVAYTMQRRADQPSPNYRTGVWYEYKLQSGSTELPLGPHTYYFTADDGEHAARWPVRPDRYNYHAIDLVDWWVPTESLTSDRRPAVPPTTPPYVDNDYVPGPYVNHAPTVAKESVSVTPGTGKEGTHFLYKANYADADGQRVYEANIWIELNDRGDKRCFAMVPDPKYNIDPTANNSALYKSGIDFIFSSDTIQDLALEKGVRRFYVEFTDDWGRQNNVNDLRKGETTRYPAGDGNWVSGPAIEGNTPPTLSNGSVDSEDGTANAATLWTFRANYRDIDNDPPALIKVFIGQLQPPDKTVPVDTSKVKTILWDAGHTMVPSGSGDTVYSKGVGFNYKAYLGGPEIPSIQRANVVVTNSMTVTPSGTVAAEIALVMGVFIDGDANNTNYYTGTLHPFIPGETVIHLGAPLPNPTLGQVYVTYMPKSAGIRYYYAFEAYDGIDYATYKNSSDEDVRSDAAGCFILQDAVSDPNDLGTYKIRPKIAKQLDLTAATTLLDPDPAKIGDIVTIWGVFTNEDLSGTNYCDPPIDYTQMNGLPITLNASIPAGRVWVVCEADTPIVGPLPVVRPAPAGVFADAEVFRNFSSNGTPLLVTDQKNGYVQDPGVGTDRAVVLMGGGGVYQGKPSGLYVAPDYPDTIASVEGVYWLEDTDDAHKYDNYYDPAMLASPVVREGTLLNLTSVALADPDEVYKVLGVYDNPNLTGINYYPGEGYANLAFKWQPAWVISRNVIWPTRPMDIVSIHGVFLGMNDKDAAGNFLTPDPTPAMPMHYVVPAVYNGSLNIVTISSTYNRSEAISAILKIAKNADMSGNVYYTSTNPAGDPYTGAPITPTTRPAASGTVYVSYVAAVNFGSSGEFMALKTPLTPGAMGLPTQVYIAYYSPGDLDLLKRIPLAIGFPHLGEPAYVKIWAKGFNPGDRYIKLTTKLRDIAIDATAMPPSEVAPADSSKLSEIGEVTGVFIVGDPINYYMKPPDPLDPTAPPTPKNPFKAGDTTIHLGTALPNPIVGVVKITYQPKQRNVTIKYSDIRYTHVFSGTAQQVNGISYDPNTGDPDPSMATGTTHFVPDGATTNSVVSIGVYASSINGVYIDESKTGTNYYLNAYAFVPFKAGDSRIVLTTPLPVGLTQVWVVYVDSQSAVSEGWSPVIQSINITGNTLDPDTGNPRDVDGGVVGVWLTPDFAGTNYFNPRRVNLYDDNPKRLRLSTQVPTGTGALYARAYQKGVFLIDRWNRNLRFGQNSPIDGTDRIQVSYFFGARMPKVLVPNTLPSLAEGKVIPITGSRNAQYVYSVRYTDIDGPNGQKPAYVRVYIDGVPNDMVSATAGTPVYKSGALFTYTPIGGLVGGSHTYHFEASDGAAIAWFDKNGAHQTERGLSTLDVVDLDGPWVNDPPQLTNGVVAPNPVPGGISTKDSVDYTVNLKDVDNDAPYVFDPLRDTIGESLSGSPRVWVDAAINDDAVVPMIGTIVGLEPDPLEITKKRVIVVKIDDGSGSLVDPTWTPDQFAGKLMQISNGEKWSDISPSPYLRVYLIQSNTANKLVIATDTLDSDMLLVAADPATKTPRFVEFRINGLLMTKVDTTQENYALGVDYKITIPRLAVGSHKFHFTARTRETKPLWLLKMVSYTNKDPYSMLVRFPALGDLTGPNVISITPPGNQAPVLSRIGTSTIYRGPKAQYATVGSPNRVKPPNYNAVLSVVGVYVNANFDAHLPAAQQIDYFDATSTPNPPATPDSVKLSTNLRAIPDNQDLIQHGKVIDLLTVEPDVASAIDTVIAVYLSKDPTLEGTAYLPTPPAVGGATGLTIGWDPTLYNHGQDVYELQVMRSDLAFPVRAITAPSLWDLGHTDLSNLYGTGVGTVVKFNRMDTGATAPTVASWTVPAEGYGIKHQYRLRVLLREQTGVDGQGNPVYGYTLTNLGNSLTATAVEPVTADHVISPLNGAPLLVSQLLSGDANFRWASAVGANQFRVTVWPVESGIGPTWSSSIISFSSGAEVALPDADRLALASVLSAPLLVDKEMLWRVDGRHASDSSSGWTQGDTVVFRLAAPLPGPLSVTLGAGSKITLTSALPAGTTDVYIKYRPITATQATKADGTDSVRLTGTDGIAYVAGVYRSVDLTDNLGDMGIWKPGDTSVQLLGAPIESGTDLVVKYVPWPPVYIKYFAVEPTNAKPPIHGIFIAGEPVTFKILYKDADGDPPTYHDGVQGYVKVVFNDTGRTSQLAPMGVGSTYVLGVPFGVTLTDVPEGIHPYHFEASDGYVISRFPLDPTGSGVNDERVQVNYKPTLSSGSVDHVSGASLFTFSVTYSDRDNVAPAAGGFVQVTLRNSADPTKTLTVQMAVSQTAPNYTNGVRYSGVVDASLKKPDGSSVLPPGLYNIVFEANDGVQDADPLTTLAPITVREFNRRPVIVDYEVKKLMAGGLLGNGAGKTTDTFVYRAWYMDEDGDAPVYVASNGQRQTALTLIIDKDQTTEQRLPMTRVTLTPPVDPDYTLPAGIEFQARVTGKKLGAGNHTYTVFASDGTENSNFAEGVLTIKPGPILMIPFFQIEIVGKDGEPITDRSIVGQEVLIKGTMYFPYTLDAQPSGIDNITIQVTKPDSAAVALNASLTNVRASGEVPPKNWLGDIVVRYSGYADPALITGQSLTLTASGQWVINASWAGDSLYDGAETDATMDGNNDQVRITVSGPSRTIAVVDPLKPDTSTPVPDMITPPMMIGSTNPSGIFGSDRALSMQIVRWSPSSAQYFWYDIGGVFPPMQPGDAVWIKPKLGSVTVPGSGYPVAEPLGSSYVIAAIPSSQIVVPISVYASHINGVYLNSSKTGANYYVYGLALAPFKPGAAQVALTSSLPDGTAVVYVDYVGSQSGVDEGWITLDNPDVQNVSLGKNAITGDEDYRYFHSRFRLVKVLAQAYPLMTGLTGAPVLDSDTKLPLLKPISVSLSAGWNQFGNIFFNWKKTSQAGTPAVVPPTVGSASAKSVGIKAIDQWNVVPTDKSLIGKVLGVYLNQQLSGINYYQPGISTQPYRRLDDKIHLTQSVPGTTTTVYIKYEAYPRKDVGIPFNEVHVTHLGVTKTLGEAKAAGWITDYAWRYDAAQHSYGDEPIRDTAKNAANRVLNAWSGYWIRAYTDCQLEINPNTTFNGVFTTPAAAGVLSSEQIEMPPPAPN